MKQKIKGKNCAVFYFAGFFLKKNFCYEVFAKQKKKKESSNYYCLQLTGALVFSLP
jgi:hypothetical protein